MGNPRTIWRDDDWVRAKRMRRGGMSYRHIAEALHISEDRVKMKFANDAAKLRMERGEPVRKNGVVPNSVLLERDRAKARPITLTAEIFGDPLPGRSALDKKRSSGAPT